MMQSSVIFSQNFNSGTLYSFNKYSTNSGYAGLSGNKLLSLNIREQWVSLIGRPRNYSFNFSTPLYKWNGAAGIKVGSYNIGIQNSIRLDLSYNYVQQSSFGLFSFGIGSGIKSLSIDKNKIVTPEGNYEDNYLNHNDPLIDDNLSFQSSFLNFSAFGVYHFNNIEVGIIFDKELSVKGKLKYGLKDAIKLNWQYIYSLNEDVSFKFFGLIYSDFVILQNDIGVVSVFKNNYIGGLNFRGYDHNTFDSFSLILGSNINYKMRLIYSVDFTISRLRKAEDGSHEIKLIYNFGEKKLNRILPPIINNPRL